MDQVIADLRDGWRSLRARPRLAALAILTLVPGVGAAGAVFGIAHAVLLRPLAYSDPGRLVMVWETHRTRADLEPTSLSNYLDLEADGRMFAATAAWGRPAPLALTSTTPARVITGCQTTAGLFRTLGVTPALGRWFVPDDEIPGAGPVVVISHDLWRSGFGASRDAIGLTLSLDETPFRIVGVMPAGFRSPAGAVDAWLPLTRAPNEIDRGQNYLKVVARLAPGTTLEQAQAAADSLAGALERRYPATNTGTGLRLVPLTEQVVGRARPMLLIALAAAGLVLLVTCANVAGLRLVQAAGREREMAVRMALGASRARIVRLLVAENLLLGLIGAAAGAGAAFLGQDLLRDVLGRALPRMEEARFGWLALGFMLAVSLAIGVVAGIVPAWSAGRGAPDAVLRGGAGRTLTGDRRQGRWRRGFASLQIATAVVLLVSGGLLVRSFARLRAVDPGFDPEGTIAARITLGGAYEDPGSRIAYFDRLIERLEGLPGVRRAGAVTVLPMSPFGIDFDVPYHRAGTPEPERAAAPKARFRSATPGYFGALDVALVAGRPFGAADGPDAPRVVIVNRTLARRAWPGEDPVGQRLAFFWSDWQTYQVVGVVEDTKSYGLADDSRPELFVPYAQNPYLVMNLIVRARTGAAALIPAVRDAILEADPLQPASGLTTMQDLVADSTSRQSMVAALVGALAALAQALALIGVYGVVAHSVEQRVREFGIRIALGARRRHIVGMVAGSTARMLSWGVGPGVLVAWAVSRALSSQLFEIPAGDPVVFLTMPALIAIAALLAGHIPARRAAAVDPSVALQSDH